MNPTDEGIMNLIIREVHSVAAGFDVYHIRTNPEEPLSIFGIEEEDLTELSNGIASFLRSSFDIEIPPPQITLDMCILDIYVLLEKELRDMGVEIKEVNQEDS